MSHPLIIEKNPELEIEEIPGKYPKQWVTVHIAQKDKYGFPIRVKVLLCGDSLNLDMVAKIKSLQGDLYTFYTGSIDDYAE